ncbi:MAG: riboflavin biosynthesis protein RibF [Planctomycetota bacterium]
MPSALTLGNFDGVHLGHRALLHRCAQLAAADPKAPLEVVAVTFDPPPAAILRPDALPPRLLTLADRIARLEEAGADRVVVLEATSDLLAQSPEQFIAALVADHAPRHLVTGPDFRFGHQRAGDAATLAALGPTHGFTAHTVDPVTVDLSQGLAAPCRSSLVRTLVGQARLDDAARCLTQPFALTAQVVQGDQRGRTIGFPTANLDHDALAPFMLPPNGVYAATAALPDSSLSTANSSFPAAVSIGPKPTFQGTHVTVEAHLIDPPEQLIPHPDALYGQPITLAFHRYLRDQQRFPGLDALVAQLHRDVAQARDALRDTQPQLAT